LKGDDFGVATEVVERELKYEADGQVRVPDVRSLIADGRVEGGQQTLDSVYFDTDHRDLLAFGVTLRCRTGTADSGWQLKIPTGQARTEVRLDLTDNDSVVPTELAALVLGVRRGRSLKHVVTVRTNRSTSRLLTAGGDLIAEIADDRVDAVAPGPGTVTLSQWREIEAELGPAGTEELLAAVDAQLIEAGATRSGRANKVARALDEPPDGPESGRPATDTAGEVIRAYLAEQDQALVMGDLSLRRGLGAIHPTRVATRRLRSTLRIFAHYVQAEPAAALDAELSWYADLLGQVRDREVQRARFAETVAELPAELVLGPVAATIEQQLLREQLQHQKTLRTAMNGRRYLALLRDVQRWVTDPPFTDRAADKATALRGAVRTAERKVGKHLEAALAGDDDEELHKARKAGKRARYAAELASPVVGGKVQKRIKRYEELQDILGDYQDGVVAAALLRRLATGTAQHGNENGFTYGLLYAHEQRRAEHSRQLARGWTR
jgi:CHAD domain-containing protein